MSNNLEKIAIDIRMFLDDDIGFSFNNLNIEEKDAMIIEFDNVDTTLLLEDSSDMIDVSKFLNSNLKKEDLVNFYSIPINEIDNAIDFIKDDLNELSQIQKDKIFEMSR